MVKINLFINNVGMKLVFLIYYYEYVVLCDFLIQYSYFLNKECVNYFFLIWGVFFVYMVYLGIIF